MNIFYLDEDPVRAARWLADKHIRKMGIESVQMLSRAYNLPEADHPPPRRVDGSYYRGGYRHHPDTVWAVETAEQWDWLARHAATIFEEYRHRFEREQAPERALAYMLAHRPTWLGRGWRPPPQCLPEVYKRDDPIAAYRAYYAHDKAHLHQWTRRPPPPWLDDYRRPADPPVAP